MRRIFLSFLMCLPLALNAGNLMTVVVDSSHPQFVVRLPSNPTTGYQWSLTKYDHGRFQLINTRYVPNKTNLMGAGGTTSFTFGTIKGQSYPKNTILIFTYARAWDPKSGSVREVMIRFK